MYKHKFKEYDEANYRVRKGHDRVAQATTGIL